jgi:hypothetical protein
MYFWKIGVKIVKSTSAATTPNTVVPEYQGPEIVIPVTWVFGFGVANVNKLDHPNFPLDTAWVYHGRWTVL